MISYILRKTVPPFLIFVLIVALCWRFIADFPGQLALASLFIYQCIWWILHLLYIRGIRSKQNQIGVMMSANLLAKSMLAIAGGVALHFGGFFEPKDNILLYAGFYFLYSILINRHALQFFKTFQPKQESIADEQENQEEDIVL